MDTRVALVTGGAKRIGKGIVLRLHADGFRICLHCHNSTETAQQVVDELNAIRPSSARVCVTDLAVSTDAQGHSLAQCCRRLIDECYNAFGRCDVLVNNASAYKATPLLASPEEATGPAGRGYTPRLEEDAGDLFGSNAIAPFYLTRAFARAAVEAQRTSPASSTPIPAAAGHRPCIVNLVDSMANQPLADFTVYTMAKHALEGLTKSAAAELAAVGIRVNAVGPGLCVMPPVMSDAEQAVYRRKVPLGQREATVEDIAAAVAFLVSSEAKYITGTTINVDGGWSLTRA